MSESRPLCDQKPTSIGRVQVELAHLPFQRAGVVRRRLPDRDHRFLSNNPPEIEWSGFLSEGYELKDSAEAEAAFGKAFEAVYGGAVRRRCRHVSVVAGSLPRRPLIGG